jgi:hypothetical protein
MSYIRSTSNPERLLVWETGGKVYFALGSEDSIETLRSIPSQAFHAFMRRHVIAGRIIGMQFKGIRLTATRDCKVRLSYSHSKRWFRRPVVMYEVTWDYIASRYQEEMEGE